MSPQDESYWQNTNQRRRFDERRGRLDVWLDALIYFGLGQQLLLALPSLWIVFQTLRTPVAVSTAAIVSLAATSLTIAVSRLGLVSVGPPWTRIEENSLGLGRDAGYGFLVRRAAVLNATLGLSTFAGAFVDANGGGLLGSIVVSGGLTAGALLALPTARAAPRAQSLAVRAGYYAVALATIALYGQVFDLSIGAPSAAFAFGLVCLFAGLDLWMDR
ncbi:hypothetical protein ACFQJC_09885 [Haloferax namakaokahaiae]|uniref:DUF8215 domain-containing protein n=1 Tax=Haloferax namakaokahaiae TaxID=1748331 RepID=A0ABD5ZEV5_9EURY